MRNQRFFRGASTPGKIPETGVKKVPFREENTLAYGFGPSHLRGINELTMDARFLPEQLIAPQPELTAVSGKEKHITPP